MFGFLNRKNLVHNLCFTMLFDQFQAVPCCLSICLNKSSLQCFFDEFQAVPCCLRMCQKSLYFAIFFNQLQAVPCILKCGEGRYWVGLTIYIYVYMNARPSIRLYIDSQFYSPVYIYMHIILGYV